MREVGANSRNGENIFQRVDGREFLSLHDHQPAGGIMPASYENHANTYDVTQLLIAWGQGDQEAFHGLFTLVYEELKRLAHRHLLRENHPTLQTTELVHEAYVKLFRNAPMELQDRRHFLNVAARAMRQVLVERARSRSAGKRNGVTVELNDVLESSLATVPDEELIALDEALRRMEGVSERKARVVELYGFIGFTVEETAEILDVDRTTVFRDWNFAKAWLSRELKGKEPE